MLGVTVAADLWPASVGEGQGRPGLVLRVRGLLAQPLPRPGGLAARAAGAQGARLLHQPPDEPEQAAAAQKYPGTQRGLELWDGPLTSPLRQLSTR